MQSRSNNRRKQHKPLRINGFDNSAGGNDDINGEAVDERVIKSNVELSASSLVNTAADTPNDVTKNDEIKSFPTKYHQLGSELIISQSQVTDEDSISPLSEKTVGSNENELIGRVFHPDAFCELCNKEFCNKYFLKTHLLHKHGITNLNDNFDSVTDGNNHTLPSADDQSNETVKSSPRNDTKDIKPEAVIITKPSVDTVGNTVTTTNLVSGIVTPDKFPMYTSVDVNEKKHSGMLSEMEDFCEFCQKHFCNKYYLKKHKLDVHGISVETQSTNRKRTNAAASVGNINLSALLPPAMLSTSVANTALNDFNSLTNVMLLNPFVSMLPTTSLSITGSNIAGSPFATTMLPSTVSVATSMPISLTTGAANIANEAVNKSSFCELCKKDFHDNYFLKIHQVSNHGFPPDDLLSAGFRDIMSRPGIINSSLFNGEKKAKLDTSDAINSSISDNRRQQNGSDNKPVLGENSNIIEDFTSGMFGNSASVRLADRVICDICNKEVCNKYFLKTHKQKVHGIDLAVLENESEEIKRDNIVFNESSLLSADGKPQDAKDAHLTEEGLIKMGIDPEAYCDICKKEFSSKYFLKTHKLNIHGITSERTPIKILPQDEVSKIILSAKTSEDMKGVEAGIAADLSKSEHHLPNDVADALGIYRKRAKKALRMGNSGRVMCEICEREVCNKYFLKTHMLKKHGIVYNPPPCTTIQPGDFMTQDSNASTNSVNLDSNGVLDMKVPTTNHDHNPLSLGTKYVNNDDPQKNKFKLLLDESKIRTGEIGVAQGNLDSVTKVHKMAQLTTVGTENDDSMNEDNDYIAQDLSKTNETAARQVQECGQLPQLARLQSEKALMKMSEASEIFRPISTKIKSCAAMDLGMKGAVVSESSNALRSIKRNLDMHRKKIKILHQRYSLKQGSDRRNNACLMPKFKSKHTETALKIASSNSNDNNNGSDCIVTCPPACVNNPDLSKVIMQEFIIDQVSPLPYSTKNDMDITFPRSLIQLPVRNSVTEPVRVTFVLTPTALKNDIPTSSI